MTNIHNKHHTLEIKTRKDNYISIIVECVICRKMEFINIYDILFSSENTVRKGF